MNHSALWYFDHFGLLQGLSAAQKQQVEEKTRMLHLKRGDAVYLPGDPTEHVYVVKTGAVKIVGTSPEGGVVILAVLMPGDIFGELALTGEEAPQDDRAEAMEDTLLCEVPRDLMIRMIEETPALYHLSTIGVGGSCGRVLCVHGSGSFHGPVRNDDINELGHRVGSADAGPRFERLPKTCAPTRWTVPDIQWEVAPRAPVQGRCASREAEGKEHE